MERLIVFGGSFDPIHNGHLRIAQAASFALNADVVFVPARKPRWKTTEASAADRLAMLKIALASSGSGAFYIDTVELDGDAEENYSIDTVRYLQRKNPKKRLYLLIGADQVNAFPRWREAKALSRESDVCYIRRDGVPVDEETVAAFHMRAIDYDKAGSVSSSSVRELRSLDIPAKVLGYIESHGLYFMKKVIPRLSKERLIHSVSVARLGFAIAERNGIASADKAYVAGLLHDLGKSLPEEEARKIVRDNFPSAYADYPAWALHQFTGRYLAEKDFGIADQAALDAIEFHCTGKAHMPPLGKIIYSADKIEPTRGYDSSKMIHECLKDYYMGFLTVLSENRKFLMEKGYDMDIPLSKECFDMYLGGKK
ncbi:MAG: nicotinate (nicotinamide) nucleotide adenylyltransferase [Bacilli bacterium]|jgi:nicotinate-nucleotide adenylyltransferase|nr:nicotinate (nicotinamide) nucleotide adenylyltransferase [Bacilli bacterium]MCI2111288.1 nicotinate (nicotinamide) nucleotide adenylyltransferase [Bacilli bacterium]